MLKGPDLRLPHIDVSLPSGDDLLIRYSFMTNDSFFMFSEGLIKELLFHGIRVICLEMDPSDACFMPYRSFQTVGLLQCYPCDKKLHSPVYVADGIARDELFDELSRCFSTMNVEQYRIEHAPVDGDLVVEAGAGTGKTKVMIDRIMFLLHMVDDLRLSDIGMITFTNEATRNMARRIRRELMARYSVTKLPAYVRFMEEVSTMQISTIHSFSNTMVSELGSYSGYAHKVRLRSMAYEKSQLVTDVLNDQYLKYGSHVSEALGLSLNDVRSLLLDFWKRLEDRGLTDREIATLDWGKPMDEESVRLHRSLSECFSEVYRRYDQLKIAQDAIAVEDIIRELSHIVSGIEHLSYKGHPLRYLFVDEFQDSDNSQIRLMSWLRSSFEDLRLFVVGDVKQSIYRFRGAEVTAFDRLRETMPAPMTTFPLVRNYRTSRSILKVLHSYFSAWKDKGILTYDHELIAQKLFEGSTHVYNVMKRSQKSAHIDVIRKALAELKTHLASVPQDEPDPDRDRVVALTRTNNQLTELASWCNEAGIPCYIRQEGTFYSSPAVRSFFAMVRGYLYPEDMSALVELICSPYVGGRTVLSGLKIDGEPLLQPTPEMTQYLISTGYARHLDEMRLRPVLSVLLSIVGESHHVEHYAAYRKADLLAKGRAKRDIDTQVAIDVAQYAADTRRLLIILRQHFSGDMVSLHSIYQFLSLMIATDKSTDQEDVSLQVGPDCLYGMTVHKAKGLEFDTVIIPRTDRKFRYDDRSEILLAPAHDGYRVGWSQVVRGEHYGEVAMRRRNDYYDQCVLEEEKENAREEARLLYVALTRSIRSLWVASYMGDQYKDTWTDMMGVHL